MTRISPKVSHEEPKFMSRAIKLARRGLGRTSPNPMVGAVVVKDGRIVGEGFHRAPGEPHAEVEAIRAAGIETQGAELFVTLEPCNHYGRTPPCTQAILAAGIKKVYYGIDDPNPSVIGGGAEFLRKAGMEVVGQILEHRCKALNEAYLTNVTLRRPYVYLKLAMSLDGRIATRSGHSQWITSEHSRMKAHRLRNRVCGIMVGIETILADNPFLTTRLKDRSGRDPGPCSSGFEFKDPTGRKYFQPDLSFWGHNCDPRQPPFPPQGEAGEKGRQGHPDSQFRQGRPQRPSFKPLQDGYNILADRGRRRTRLGSAGSQNSGPLYVFLRSYNNRWKIGAQWGLRDGHKQARRGASTRGNAVIQGGT